MTYKEKLLDPRWQKKRLEVLQRDEFTCQQCGDKEETLHIHHFCYPKSRNPWDSDELDLITYCASCHTLEEYLKTTLQDFTILDIIKTKYKDFTQLTCIFYNDNGVFYVTGFELKNNVISFDKFIIPIGQYWEIEQKINKWKEFIKKHATNG